MRAGACAAVMALAALGVPCHAAGATACTPRAVSVTPASPGEFARSVSAGRLTGPSDLDVGNAIEFAALAGPKSATVVIHGGSRPTYWFKALTAVRPGPAVTLSVPRSERGRLALRYVPVRNGQTPRRIEDAPTSVRFIPCAHGRAWRRFAGGFLYRAPGCYVIHVRVAGLGPPFLQRIALGRGATCA